ncbi:hypothetical protein F5890DRAFT_1422592, partial [Lentinula detonsa]
MAIAGLLLLALQPFIGFEENSAGLSCSKLLLDYQILLQAVIYFHRASFSVQEAVRPCPEVAGQRITIEYLLSLPCRECIWRFRFSAPEIFLLVKALDIPDPFRTQGRYCFTAVEALSLLLVRYRSGCDQFELQTKYDRCQSSLSEVLNELIEYLDERWKHLLDCDRDGVFHPDQLATYADAISARGAPLSNCIGFLDCTIRKICRPSFYQEVCYNGYKKIHALKYQAIIF